MGLTVGRAGRSNGVRMKMVLKIGAVICAMIGLWVIYVAVVNFWNFASVWWNVSMLLFELALLALAFGPGFLIWKGFARKRGHWIVIAIAEGIVLGMAVVAVLALVAPYLDHVSVQE